MSKRRLGSASGRAGRAKRRGPARRRSLCFAAEWPKRQKPTSAIEARVVSTLRRFFRDACFWCGVLVADGKVDGLAVHIALYETGSDGTGQPPEQLWGSSGAIMGISTSSADSPESGEDRSRLGVDSCTPVAPGLTPSGPGAFELPAVYARLWAEGAGARPGGKAGKETRGAPRRTCRQPGATAVVHAPRLLFKPRRPPMSGMMSPAFYVRLALR